MNKLWINLLLMTRTALLMTTQQNEMNEKINVREIGKFK